MLTDADMRDVEGYWAHAHWTLWNGKKEKGQMRNCGTNRSTLHMSNCARGGVGSTRCTLVRLDVKEIFGE